jgi:ParB family chromosome partitioning protein
MKLEALNKQGKRTDLTFSRVGKKLNSYEDVAENSPDSRNQIHRYIRLTHLVPSLLELVDQKRIAFGPAVEISYLTNAEQFAVLSAFESEETTPSLSQAQRLKKLSQEGKLDEDKTFEILTEEKANQKEQIKFKVDSLKKYFPKDYSPKQMEDVMIKLLYDWQRKREQNRDAR